MTADCDYQVPADATHLVVYDAHRALVSAIDLAAEHPRGIYIPKGDSLHVVREENGIHYVWSPPIDQDGNVELSYLTPAPAPRVVFDADRYTGAFDNKPDIQTGFDAPSIQVDPLRPRTITSARISSVSFFKDSLRPEQPITVIGDSTTDKPVDYPEDPNESVADYIVRSGREELAERPKTPILQYFAYAHLPSHLIPISRFISQVAHDMDAELPDGPEKSAGLRKLLEAKDCFVRAAL